MIVSLQVADDDASDVAAELQAWLGYEPLLRGHITLVMRQPEADELGSAADLISVAVGAGGALSALATSLKTFFAQPRRSDVRITIQTEDGRIIEIDAKRVNDVDKLVTDALGAEK